MQTLTTVDISNSQIGEKGAQILAWALKYHTVIMLHSSPFSLAFTLSIFMKTEN